MNTLFALPYVGISDDEFLHKIIQNDFELPQQHTFNQLDELNLVHLNTQTIEPMIKKTILTQRITFIIVFPQILFNSAI